MTSLDVDRHGFVSASDLYKFLRGEGVEVSNEETELLIEIYDSDLNGKLEMSELQWAIEGFETSTC